MQNPLSNNWQAKLISLVIALAIWIYIKNLEDVSFIDRLMSGTLTSGH